MDKHTLLRRLLLTPLLLLLMAIGMAQATTISGGEYEVVVAIDPAMAEDATMVGKIETMMKAASKYLHTALKEQGLFGKVVILVPDSWPDKPEYKPSSGETVAGADIFVGKSVGCGACASPGRIQIDDGRMQGSTIVHEWGHYRFGLGDEYCDYVWKSGAWWQVYKTSAGWNRCTALQDLERSCEERKTSDPACTTNKNDVNGAKASIMHREWNAGIDSFCDNGTDTKYKHNSTVNNHQNRIHGRKSTWAVIDSHSDGFKQTGGTKITYKDPVFEVKKASKPDIVLVMDVSGSMIGSRITNAARAARNFVDRTETGSAIGVVSFSTSASTLQEITEITDAASKTTVKNAIPTSATGNTSIGAGMTQARDLLAARTSGRQKVMVLLSDGGENTSPYIAEVLPSVTDAKIRVYSVGLGAAADQALQDIAADTGGAFFFAPSGDVQALNSAFTSIVNLSASVIGSSLSSQTVTVIAGGSENFSVVIDDSLGRNTVFTFSVPVSQMLDLTATLSQPDGTQLDSSYVGYNEDAAVGVITFVIEGTAAAGEWVASVANNGINDAEVTLEATSAPELGKAGITLTGRLDRSKVFYSYEGANPESYQQTITNASSYDFTFVNWNYWYASSEERLIAFNTLLEVQLPVADMAGFDVSLLKPDGTVFDSTFIGYASDPVTGKVSFQLQGKADTGQWQVRVANNSGADADVTATASPGKTQLVAIYATLNQDDAILGANVWAEVTRPDGTTATLTLLDNGQGADQFLMDGTYSGYLTEYEDPSGTSYYNANGNYVVTVFADNANGTASIGAGFHDGSGVQSDKMEILVDKAVAYQDAIPWPVGVVAKPMLSGRAALTTDFQRVAGAGGFLLDGFDEVKAVGVSDVIPPGQISSLSIIGQSDQSVVLSWIASGDDEDFGQAASYDLRYSTTDITSDAEFDAATQITVTTPPKSAGEPEQFTVTNLAGNTQFYFALRAVDDAGLVSKNSNVVSADLSAVVGVSDLIPPGQITSLAEVEHSSDSVTLSWSAPGDDQDTGQAVSYDLRYSVADITNEADFDAATPVSITISPKMAGELEQFTVANLAVDGKFYFALRAVDEVGLVGPISNVLYVDLKVVVDQNDGGGSGGSLSMSLLLLLFVITLIRRGALLRVSLWH